MLKSRSMSCNFGFPAQRRFPNATTVICHAKLRIKLFPTAAPRSVHSNSQSRHLAKEAGVAEEGARSVADHTQDRKAAEEDVRHRQMSCRPVTQAAGTNPSRFPPKANRCLSSRSTQPSLILTLTFESHRSFIETFIHHGPRRSSPSHHPNRSSHHPARMWHRRSRHLLLLPRRPRRSQAAHP